MQRNNGKIVYVPIEVYKREWQAKLVFACQLVKNGFNVVFGKDYSVASCALRDNSGIYFRKSMCANGDIVPALKDRGFYVCVFDEEGVVIRNYDDYVKVKLDLDTLRMSDVILSWGEKEASYIKKFAPELEKKIVCVGNVRMDLMRKDFSNLFKKEVDCLRARYGRYILVNTNFLFGVDEEALLRTESFQKEKGMKNTLSVRKDRQISIELDFLKGVKSIAKAVECCVIIRPHPSESSKKYMDYFSDIHNIHVTKEGNVNAWILGAEAVIHNSCTTGVEAFLAEKPVVAYLPGGMKIVDDAISNKISHIVTNEDQLACVVRNIMVDGIDDVMFDRDSKYNELLKYIEYDKECSVADKIISILTRNNNPTDDMCVDNIKHGFIANVKEMIAYIENSTKTSYKMEALYHTSIEADANEICKRLNLGINVKVSAIDKNVWKMEKYLNV